MARLHLTFKSRPEISNIEKREMRALLNLLFLITVLVLTVLVGYQAISCLLFYVNEPRYVEYSIVEQPNVSN